MVVLATSTLVIKKKEELKRVLYIHYSITFKDQIEALLDSRSKINVMSQIFAYQLGLTI